LFLTGFQRRNFLTPEKEKRTEWMSEFTHNNNNSIKKRERIQRFMRFPVFFLTGGIAIEHSVTATTDGKLFLITLDFATRTTERHSEIASDR
jgi:hypothetical protein